MARRRRRGGLGGFGGFGGFGLFGRSGRNRRIVRGDGSSVGEIALFVVGGGLWFAMQVMGDALFPLLGYGLAIGVLVFFVYVVGKVVASIYEDDGFWRRGQQTPRQQQRRIARNYRLGTDPPGVIEIDPAWPGRTRIRIPASTALPMAGPARFVPRTGLRVGNYAELRWHGEGAADARQWEPLFEPHFRAILRAAREGGFQVNLSPAGMIIHLPFVVPRDRGIDLLERHANLLSTAMRGITEREERVLGLTFVEAEQQHTADCSCCWTAVGASEAVVCPDCGGMQHADCAQWAGGCARFACERELDPVEREPAA